MFCVIYLDDSKIRKLYQQTLSFTTRLSSTGGSIAEHKNSVIVKHSTKTGATSKILQTKPAAIQKQESFLLTNEPSKPKSKLTQKENVTLEMKELK